MRKLLKRAAAVLLGVVVGTSLFTGATVSGVFNDPYKAALLTNDNEVVQIYNDFYAPCVFAITQVTQVGSFSSSHPVLSATTTETALKADGTEVPVSVTETRRYGETRVYHVVLSVDCTKAVTADGKTHGTKIKLDALQRVQKVATTLLVKEASGKVLFNKTSVDYLVG